MAGSCQAQSRLRMVVALVYAMEACQTHRPCDSESCLTLSWVFLRVFGMIGR